MPINPTANPLAVKLHTAPDEEMRDLPPLHEHANRFGRAADIGRAFFHVHVSLTGSKNRSEYCMQAIQRPIDKAAQRRDCLPGSDGRVPACAALVRSGTSGWRAHAAIVSEGKKTRLLTQDCTVVPVVEGVVSPTSQSKIIGKIAK